MKTNKKALKLYRGYLCEWKPSSYAGHWIIYDKRNRFLGSADEFELDRRIDELESEG